MNLNISKYINVWQRTVIPWTYWKHHLCLQAYRATVAHIKHASVLPHLSPDHHFSSSDPASVMKTQRETANLLTFFLTYLLTFFLTYLLKFFLTYLLTFFLTYLLTFFLTYLLTCFLTYLLTYLSDISETKHSTHSFTQKPLHKLYIYLTPRSKSNIHDSFVSVKWQFYSCIRLHRTAPPRSSWVQRCKAPVATHTQTHTHTTHNTQHTTHTHNTHNTHTQHTHNTHTQHTHTTHTQHTQHTHNTKHTHTHQTHTHTPNTHTPKTHTHTHQTHTHTKHTHTPNTHTHIHTHTHHMHQTAPPKKQLSLKMPCKWAHSRNYISRRVQTMKSDACHCGSFTSSV